MDGCINMLCTSCGSGMYDGDDGHYYCITCGLQSQDFVETATQEDEFFSGIYSLRHRRNQNTEQTQNTQQTLASQKTPGSQNHHLTNPDGTADPYDHQFSDRFPTDFGILQKLSPEELASAARMRYVEGLQMMIQLQCEALVQKFGANPLICGLVGPIWLRFVAASKVFDQGWANEAMMKAEEEFREQGAKGERKLPNDRMSGNSSKEPRTLYGERAIDVWVRSLKRRIPLASSLAITFLACHVSREAILPTDMIKWVLEGKIPYISAFVDIEKCLGSPSDVCLSGLRLFRPLQVFTDRQLESLAGSIAKKIGLHLPPVNFYLIASRYLKQLSLPVEKILPYACRIYEWSMPPDLWLSANQYRLPTRVCVMSIIIVAIRLLYNINGQGQWERSLSNSSCNGKLEKTKNACKSEKTGNACKFVMDSYDLDTPELLCHLEAAYDKIGDTYDYSKDLRTYLRYCKEVVFAGLSSASYGEDDIIAHLWNIYEKQEEDINPPDKEQIGCTGSNSNSDSLRQKKPVSTSTDEKIINADDQTRQGVGDQGSVSQEPEKVEQNIRPDSPDYDTTAAGNIALMRLISNMEENGFIYTPPRRRMVKTSEYLHYERKRIKRKLTHMVHADYYILLRACARVVKVDVRIMHFGQLKLERRLSWIESHIDRSLPALQAFSELTSDCKISEAGGDP